MNKRPFLGTDLKLSYLSEAGMSEDVELATGKRLENVISKYAKEDLRKQRDKVDLQCISGKANFEQSLINRLKTHKSELEALGHPEYGSRLHELIGERNSETKRSLLKLYILEALSHEHRIEKIGRLVIKISSSDPTRVEVHIEIKAIDIPNPISLVVPFYFEGRL